MEDPVDEFSSLNLFNAIVPLICKAFTVQNLKIKLQKHSVLTDK